ncbi:MAG: hypothetical protein R2815_11430 [Flavobacteriales bacterium]
MSSIIKNLSRLRPNGLVDRARFHEQRMTGMPPSRSRALCGRHRGGA